MARVKCRLRLNEDNFFFDKRESENRMEWLLACFKDFNLDICQIERFSSAGRRRRRPHSNDIHFPPSPSSFFFAAIRKCRGKGYFSLEMRSRPIYGRQKEAIETNEIGSLEEVSR